MEFKFRGDLWNSTRQTRDAFAASVGGTAHTLTTGLWLAVSINGRTHRFPDYVVREWAWNTTTLGG